MRWITPVGVIQARSRLETAIRGGGLDAPLVFDYERVGLDEYEQALDEVEVLVGERCGEALRPAVQSHLDSARASARSLLADDATYAAASAAEHGLPSPDLIEQAHQILAVPSQRDDAHTLPVSHLVDRALAVLDAHRITGWSVEPSTSMAAKMSVNGPRRRIRVRSDARFTERTIQRLLVHEVGGHVLRWINAEHQPEPLAALALGSTVLTEEGLSLWLEEQHDLLSWESMRTYAARVLAVDISSREGIYGVARDLSAYLDPGAAAELAVRVKRGMRDPTQPGGLAKDWAYLGGLSMMRDLNRTDPAGLELLRGVKCSVDYLPLVKELASEGVIRPPTIRFDVTSAI